MLFIKKNVSCTKYFWAWTRKGLSIMKYSLFFFIVGTFTAVASVSYSQTAKFTLNMQDATVAQVLSRIESDSQFYFTYNTREINPNRVVSVQLTDVDIDILLKELFVGEDVHYIISDKHVVLYKDSKNAAKRSSQHDIRVTGIVTDNNREPLPGVNVVIKGTSTGTITDIDGRYMISVPDKESVLLFSFTGFVTQEIAVGDKTQISIYLIEDSKELDEVIVVGYGTMKKSDITGSIVSVKTDQLRDISATNAARALQGKAAGVDIVASGQKPGDGSSIRVRGTRSFKASNDPLYIIDGIPFNRWINDLNPADIESIEILKDASATAIYGSRGANGVILITTKKAKAGKSEISYDFYYGTQKPLRKLDMMDAAQYLELNRNAARATNTYPTDGSTNVADDIKMLKYKDSYVEESIRMAYDDAGNYDPSKLRSFDWPGATLQTGNIMSHQLNFTGGNDKSKVMVSAGYFKNEGIVIGQDYERLSFRVNADYEITKWLKVGGSTAFTQGIKNNGFNNYPHALSMNPLAVPRDNEGVLINRPGNDPLLWNPYYNFDEKNYKNEERRYRFMGSFFLDVNFGEGLRYRMNFGPDFGQLRTGTFAGTESTTRAGGNSIATNSQEQYMTYVLENVLYYDKTINENHRLGVTLMQSFEQERKETLNANVSDLPYEHQLFYNIGSAATITGIGSSLVEWRMLSYMGRFNYSFNDKYLITLTGRIDGSSRLSRTNKYAFFPSVALAWRMKEENFLKDIDSIDNLKLRLGYGQTGNSSISPYETLGSLSRTAYATDDVAVYGYSPNLLYNPDLKWEKTGQYNIGLDFGFFGGRISGTIDAYRQNTTDLLLERQLPTASGFGRITQNIGQTRNTGLEIGLNTINVDGKNFSWTTDWMFYTNKEEIVSLYQGKEDDIGNKWFIGHPIVTHYDYKFDGIWQNTPEDQARMALFNNNGGTFQAGDIKLYDVDGNDKITSDDRMILGTIMPKWTASMTNTFTYKNFDLSFFLYARYGQMITMSTSHLRMEGRYNNLDVDYWTPDNPSNKYPRADKTSEFPNYIEALSYQDGSFLKLKNLTLGYTLPKSVTEKIMLQRCRFYITAENLFMLTDYDGLDPENGTNRGGEGTTPSPKNMLFGLNITF
jgi:TonB-linked SusC/RagA family outer membrane protein